MTVGSFPFDWSVQVPAAGNRHTEALLPMGPVANGTCYQWDLLPMGPVTNEGPLPMGPVTNEGPLPMGPVTNEGPLPMGIIVAGDGHTMYTLLVVKAILLLQ